MKQEVLTTIFFKQAHRLFESVRDLTATNHKVILTYDAYRSHISLRALELFDENNVVVYALPAQNSSKKQTCDVTVFENLKHELNDCIGSAADVCSSDLFDS